MTQGEKFIAIAENEERIFLSGKNEGYADGFIEGSDEALDRVIEILDGVISSGETKGHTVFIDEFTSFGGTTCFISTQKPVDNGDGISLFDFIDVNVYEDYFYKLENALTLYAWTRSGDYLTISRNGEDICSNEPCTYDTPFVLTITEDTHLTILTQ